MVAKTQYAHKHTHSMCLTVHEQKMCRITPGRHDILLQNWQVLTPSKLAVRASMSTKNASLIMGMRMRFTMKPGRSSDRLTVLPRCSANPLVASNTCAPCFCNHCPGVLARTVTNNADRQQEVRASARNQSRLLGKIVASAVQGW